MIIATQTKQLATETDRQWNIRYPRGSDIPDKHLHPFMIEDPEPALAPFIKDLVGLYLEPRLFVEFWQFQRHLALSINGLHATVPTQ